MGSRIEAIRRNLKDRGYMFIQHSTNQRKLGKVVAGEQRLLGETKADRALLKRQRRFNRMLEVVVSGDRNSCNRDQAIEEVLLDIGSFEKPVGKNKTPIGAVIETSFVVLDKDLGEPSGAFFPKKDGGYSATPDQKDDEAESATPEDITDRIRAQNELYVELEYYGRLTPEYESYHDRHVEEIAALY